MPDATEDIPDHALATDACSRALAKRRIVEQLLKLFKFYEDHNIDLCSLFREAACIYDPD
jgi:hypothetical protein